MFLKVLRYKYQFRYKIIECKTKRYAKTND